MLASRFKALILSCCTTAMAVLYLAAPVHTEVLQWVHDLEHEFDHITQSEHQHAFLSEAEFLAEAGHDHRTLEYIKQVLEPFKDDLEKEKKQPQPLKIDKHLCTDRIEPSTLKTTAFKKQYFDFRISMHRPLSLLQPVPPPEV
ncbi:hypothetical protein [Leeuwenhoekiella sp. ZYFB001]|uniref:hypothetical protein n=1 Tax=Leeuwenhoekiella sp. ZYFB001 TaxID=2719912 RepID=UPI0014313F16|nr:hypothetical protein [Leeuwenhoekiella sp. ZYFB001]